ncbi:PDZ domain-containing protein [Acidobacteria bacterium AH-259-G07]|nr:PDZ domain-containing protein [Acidobacteria bacterium AH-259-G07]
MKQTLFIVITILMGGISPYAFSQEEIHIIGANGSYLGVQIRDVTLKDVPNLDLPKEAGVFVERVQEGSPAADGDLQKGDVIVEFANFPVISVRQFRRLVAETPPGRQVELVVIRDGQRIARTVTIAERKSRMGNRFSRRYRIEIPSVPELDFGDFRFHFDPDHPRFFFSDRPQLGIKGQEISEQLAETLGVPEKKGVLVMEVVKDSPGERAGLKAGDVIISVDGEQVETLGDLRRHLKSGSLELGIVRNKQKQRVRVELETREEEDRESIRI